jgi:hypothetical protein
MGHTAEYCELCACSNGNKWINLCADKIGRLCNGHGLDSKMTSGTNTLFFIPITAMTKDHKATYIRIVCADCPEKKMKPDVSSVSLSVVTKLITRRCQHQDCRLRQSTKNPDCDTC